MKRYLHFYYWLAAVIMMICSTTTMAAKTSEVKVTSLNQLKAGSIIKIYPKDSEGTSHYGESKLALSCSGNGAPLVSYEDAGSGNIWTLVNAGGGYYYLKNEKGCYWAYQNNSTTQSLTCVTSEKSAVKVSFTWDYFYNGVCFWNQKDGKGLNNLYGYKLWYNWHTDPSHGRSDANTTFDVSILQEEEIQETVTITNKGIKYLLNLQKRTAEVLANNYGGDVVIPQSVTYGGNDYAVASLEYYCFGGCSSLTSITLPNSITSLGGSCFEGCSSLTSITLPNSITSLGAAALNVAVV